jgi:hypothetical protein
MVAIAISCPPEGRHASDGRTSWLERSAHIWTIVAYALIALYATLQRGVLTHDHTTYPIFRESFYHLIRHQDLYAHYPEQGHQLYDLFKYSPTFALLFAPFALSPFVLGLLLWNACSVFALYLALEHLLPRREAGLAGLVLLTEVLASTQASQSDTLVAALIIFTFIAFERDRQLGAAGAIGLGAAIKLFPLAGLSFAVMHRRPWRAGLFALAGIVVLALLPLVVLSPHELVCQYHGWAHITRADGVTRGMSMMKLLRMIIPGAWPNWPVQLLGTGLLLLPLVLRRARWRDLEFRRTFLCSLLIYAVIFNHRAERSSFVIAVAGIAIWYATGPAVLWRTALLILSIAGLREAPCVLAWIVIQTELLRRTPSPPVMSHPRARSTDVATPTASLARSSPS